MSVLRWHSVRLRLTLLGAGLVAGTGAVLLLVTLILARPGLVAGLVLIALWTLLSGPIFGTPSGGPSAPRTRPAVNAAPKAPAPAPADRR